MKKIININFHSRVIPIEETAYDILRKYVESLKKHFAGEEGADEIVNDIENRFAELFSDRLKKGATCITDADVNEIITSMGRPEDFDQDEKTTAQMVIATVKLHHHLRKKLLLTNRDVCIVPKTIKCWVVFAVVLQPI